mgnify:CR=1 FL=1
MMGGKVGLVDRKAAQAVHRAVPAEYGNAQKDGALRSVGQGQQRRRPAVALNGRGCGIQMLAKAGKLCEVKFLRRQC